MNERLRPRTPEAQKAHEEYLARCKSVLDAFDYGSEYTLSALAQSAPEETRREIYEALDYPYRKGVTFLPAETILALTEARIAEARKAGGMNKIDWEKVKPLEMSYLSTKFTGWREDSITQIEARHMMRDALAAIRRQVEEQ